MRLRLFLEKVRVQNYYIKLKGKVVQNERQINYYFLMPVKTIIIDVNCI